MGRDVLRGLRDVAWDHKLWIHVLGLGDGVEQVGEAGDQCRLTQGDAVAGSCRDCRVHWPAPFKGLAVSGPSVAGNPGTAAPGAVHSRNYHSVLFEHTQGIRIGDAGLRSGLHFTTIGTHKLLGVINAGSRFLRTVLINFGFPGWKPRASDVLIRSGQPPVCRLIGSYRQETDRDQLLAVLLKLALTGTCPSFAQRPSNEKDGTDTDLLRLPVSYLISVGCWRG
jgi:hypothetical protein